MVGVVGILVGRAVLVGKTVGGAVALVGFIVGLR